MHRTWEISQAHRAITCGMQTLLHGGPLEKGTCKNERRELQDAKKEQLYTVQLF